VIIFKLNSAVANKNKKSNKTIISIEEHSKRKELNENEHDFT